MSCIKKYGSSCVHILLLTPPPPPKKKSRIWILCQNSLTRELKSRFVGLVLKRLFTLDKFQLELLIVSITKLYVDGCCLGFYLFLAFDIFFCSMLDNNASLKQVMSI